MSSDLFNYNEIKNSESFGVKKMADAIYRGQIKDEKRHGYGVMVYNTKRVYEGQWDNNFRKGIGVERYSNGNTYKG